MINNADAYTPNPFLQDLDYSTNALVPINIERVISGSAEKGTVPELYYTSLKQTLPRYLGSKNQSTGFNLYDPDVPTNSYFTQVGVIAPYSLKTSTYQTSSFLTVQTLYSPILAPLFPGLETTTLSSDIFTVVKTTAVDDSNVDHPITILKVNTEKLKKLSEQNPNSTVEIGLKGIAQLLNAPAAFRIGFSSIALIGGKVEKASVYYNTDNFNVLQISNDLFYQNTNPTPFSFMKEMSLADFLSKFDINGTRVEYITVALYAGSLGILPLTVGEPLISDLEPTIQINLDSKQNIGTYGQTPSVDILDTNIYEFEWADSGYPELIDGGNLKTGNILQVSSPELVKLADPNKGQKIVPILEPIEGLTPEAIGSISFITFRQVNDPAQINEPSTTQFTTAYTSSITTRGTTRQFWNQTTETNDYKQILDKGLYSGNQVKLTMYPNTNAGANPETPTTSNILSTEWGMPKSSAYAITSSYFDYAVVGGVSASYAGIIVDNTINLIRSGAEVMNKVEKDSDGFYKSSLTFRPTFLSFTDQINSDLNSGERWFVTLYNEFEYPDGSGGYDVPLTTGSLSPYNFGFEEQRDNGDYIYPLANKGIYEILGTKDTNGYVSILINQTFTEDRMIGGNGVTSNVISIPGIPNPPTISGGSLGMLMWKAESYGKSDYIVIGNKIDGFVNAGAIIAKNTAQYIDDNFEAITKQYGANPA